MQKYTHIKRYTPLSKINCNCRVLRFLSQNSLSKSPRPEVYWSHAMSGSWTTLWGRGRPISICDESRRSKTHLNQNTGLIFRYFRKYQWKSQRKLLYLFLQLVHKGDGVRQGFLLMPCQCLQVQDGLGSLGFQYTDGLEQPLITNVEDRGEGRAEMLCTLLTADAMHLTSHFQQIFFILIQCSTTTHFTKESPCKHYHILFYKYFLLVKATLWRDCQLHAGTVFPACTQRQLD